MQLPSLLNRADGQSDYIKNSVLQPGENPQEKIRHLIFIKTSVSKKTCFVGEPVLVTYQLYTAVSCHSKVIKQVAFSGCSVIEMTDDEPDQIQKEKGAIYRVQLIRKVQIIPLKAGDLTIPPATVSNEVSFSTTDNPYLQKSYSGEVSSEPYPIAVNALPEKQPENFSGITGKFTIEAKTDSTTIAAGENNRLQVTIAGAGNIEAVTEPAIKWARHTEHFDPTDSQHINRLNFPESGDKTFIFPFIVTRKGTTIIPGISFTYFNTDLKKYETITTKAIPLLITTAIKKKNPAAMMPGDVSNQNYLWLVPAIAIVVVIVWLLINSNKNKGGNKKNDIVKEEPKQTVPKESEVVAKPDYELLLTALHEAEDNKIFFANAKTLLVSALQLRLSPKQDDEVILLNLLYGIDETLAIKARKIISVCNENLYAPSSDEVIRTALIEQLSELIQRLENNQSVYL